MILWGNEHQDRAEALATAYHETAYNLHNLAISNSGIQAPTCADATLSIWGHGNAETFAELVDVECGLLIGNWKAKNSQLTTVELITCDAQHHLIPLAGYVRRVAAFLADKKIAVTLKALPVGQHADDRSILWANAGTATFAYITAPSKTTFDHANQRLQSLEGTHGYHLGATAQEMAKERTLTTPNNFTVMGGNLADLRAFLAKAESSLSAKG